MVHAMKIFLFVLLLSCQFVYAQNDTPKIVVVDTVERCNIIHPVTQCGLNPAIHSILYINDMFVWIEKCDTFPALSGDLRYAIVDFEKGRYGIKQFYSIDSMKAIPVFEAYEKNPEFVQYVIKNKFSSLLSQACFTAYGNSKLFVQFDIDYKDSILKVREPYWGKKNWYRKKAKPDNFQNPACQLVVYKDGQKTNRLYFQTDSFNLRPLGMAVYRNKYLVAGYETSFLKGYERVSDKNYFIIDTETEQVLNVQLMPYIYGLFEQDGFLFLEYYNRRKNKSFLLKCIIE